jgi:hypothetical protein
VSASIGVVLVALLGAHDSTVLVVLGGQAAVWTVFALSGRSGAGLCTSRGAPLSASCWS